MSVKTEILMSADLVSITPETTVRQARETLASEGISALPVLAPSGALLGLVTATDILRTGVERDDQSVTAIMSEHVYTVPPYADVHVAARVMRNHHVHHVVVTKGEEVAGIISSYDLLQLVEEHRYVAKGKPTTRRRGGGRQRRTEKKLAAERKADPTEAPAQSQRERLNQILGHLTRRNAAVDRDRRREGGMEADFAEQATVRENDEVLDALSKEGRDQLELVGRALERLDGGDYGTCEDCQGDVGQARLEALPYAVTCIACARKRESA